MHKTTSRSGSYQRATSSRKHEHKHNHNHNHNALSSSNQDSNFSGQKDIINAMALNSEGVLFSGGNEGTMQFWDWKTGYSFQQTKAIVCSSRLTLARAYTYMLTLGARCNLVAWLASPVFLPQRSIKPAAVLSRARRIRPLRFGKRMKRQPQRRILSQVGSNQNESKIQNTCKPSKHQHQRCALCRLRV